MRLAARSPTHRAPFEQTELVVGTQTQEGTTVHVSETLKNLRRSVMGDVLRRLAGFTVLALVAAGFVNAALSRIVARPMARLVGTMQQIGAGRLGAQSETFGNVEMNYLADEINSMSASLAATDRDRKAQMGRAREIQRNLLPKARDIPGFHVACLFQPTDDVGGDYYDIVPLSDGTWLFCVADVAGHGVPAALSAAMLKALLMQAAEQGSSPAATLAYINRRFTAVSLVGDFITMCVVRAGTQTGLLEFASAGHEPAWLLSPDGATRELSATGIPLGIQKDAKWDEVAIHLMEGHRLLLTTDGVSETYNPQGKMFGRTRIATLFADCRQLSLERTVERIRDSLTSYRNGKPSHDDVTAVLMEFATGAATSAPAV